MWLKFGVVCLVLENDIYYYYYKTVMLQFVEQMADMVKKGIEQANMDLVKENESRLMQEVRFHPLFVFYIIL